MNRISKVHISPAKCAVDLGDGSERGFYVNQDYVLRKMGRPHRGISLMYCYYPLDPKWPGRASVAYASDDVQFAWAYPYEDYFPYRGGKEGNKEGEPFNFMRDVRRHGQEVILTLTIDPLLSDEYLIAVAKDLRTYGRMMMRINHEATGDWFPFTKRATYQEIADFYIRFHKIIKEYAPNVQTILCIGGIEDPNATEIIKEKEFAEAVRTTDVWSVDKYMALNWGWPYEVALKDNNSHGHMGAELVYDLTKKSYKRYLELNGGVRKPMVMSEFNADGDVTGPYGQCEDVRKFCELLKNDEEHWFDGFTMYQFRDDGRLGLEITDPNNSEVGVEQPVLATYKEIINDDFFKPGLNDEGDITLPATLRWGGSEDSDGLAIDLNIEKDPVYAEAYFEGSLVDANLMMEINGMWFYKAPGVKFVDFMPAFFGKKLDGAQNMKLNIFAPPASGENDPSQGDDWMTNYYYEMKELPKIRIEYEQVM